MAFPRVKPAGWAFGEKLTSSHMNTLDIDHSNSVDKRSPGLEIDSRSVTRWMGGAWRSAASSGTTIRVGTGVDAGTVWFDSTANPNHIAGAPIEIPNGVTVTGFTVYLKGGAGHSALPASMPSITLFSTVLSTGVATNVGGGTDTSGTVGAFEAAHSIAVTSLSVVIDRTIKGYSLQFSSESGANSQVGLNLFGATVTFTTTRIDEL